MENSNTLSSDEKKILEALREDAQLLECVLELTEISGNKIDTLNLEMMRKKTEMRYKRQVKRY